MTTISTPILSPVDQERVVQEFNQESKALMRLLEKQHSEAAIERVESLISEISQLTTSRHQFFSDENNVVLTNYMQSLILARKIHTGSLTECAFPQQAMCA